MTPSSNPEAIQPFVKEVNVVTLCLSLNVLMHVPVTASHILMVPSIDAEAI